MNESLRDIKDALKDIPVHVSHSPFGPAPVRVWGKRGTQWEAVDVYLSSAQEAVALRHEGKRHLHMPAVWHIPLPSHNKVAWAGGYIAAKTQCLPTRGRFRPVTQVQPVNPYQVQENSAGDEVAFANGVSYYLEHVSQGDES